MTHQRWYEILRSDKPRLSIQRPCTLGDGIERLNPSDYARLESLAESAGPRLSCFVPASGAATRMGLSGPKALVPFHRYPDKTRTAFEEHCREAQEMGAQHVHFTIPPGWQDTFEAITVDLPVSFSIQDPDTQLPAITLSGDPVLVDGAPLLRPGGHGALLQNLANCDGDLLLIKNIDNVAHADFRPEIVAWRKRLLGRLIELERTHSGPEPLRVCAMVANEGEPGGGPFWVDGRVQIVEGAQILEDQKHLLEGATHFNPVDIVCSVRGRRLEDWSEPGQFILTEKTHRGTPIRVIELPGLWNGAMAGWRTVFVEVPAFTFQPVKRPADLDRPFHNPRSSS